MKHIAIIMDGNRRFAKKHNKPASFGHEKGSEVIKSVCEYARKCKIPFLTLFAFSTENWNRTEDEVNSLNSLLEKFLTKESKYFIQNKIKVLIIGDKTAYSPKIQKQITDLEKETQNFEPFTLCIALNYGGRAEILDAVNKALKNGKNEITINEFESHLQTSTLPDVDLLIRTGGAKRLSNFILWKLTYSELYFTDVLWPEFTEDEFQKAINFLNAQVRNFGS